MAQKNVSAASEAVVEVTMQEFADLLNVSQPFVAPLLESGDFPFRVVGTKRFVPRFDALVPSWPMMRFVTPLFLP